MSGLLVSHLAPLSIIGAPSPADEIDVPRYSAATTGEPSKSSTWTPGTAV
jgi:hypothetical protein